VPQRINFNPIATTHSTGLRIGYAAGGLLWSTGVFFSPEHRNDLHITVDPQAVRRFYPASPHSNFYQPRLAVYGELGRSSRTESR